MQLVSTRNCAVHSGNKDSIWLLETHRPVRKIDKHFFFFYMAN